MSRMKGKPVRKAGAQSNRSTAVFAAGQRGCRGVILVIDKPGFLFIKNKN